MANKDLEGIVNSETSKNNGVSTKQYSMWKLAGHALGAVSTISSAYLLEQVLGYGKAATSAISEIVDYAVDNAGFNLARYSSEGKKKIYQGMAGIGKYIAHSVGYAVRHIPGSLLGMGAAALATYGLSTIYNVPVYIASIAPRAFEIITETLSSIFFTRKYRGHLSQISPHPA